MGADGGINWVNVTGDKDEFYSLVAPFNLLWNSSKNYDQYHDDYLEKNPLHTPKVGFLEVSIYGSFEATQGMDDLEELIRELGWYLRRQPYDDAWGDQNPLDLTWKEMLEEYHTADYWKEMGKWSLPEPMRLMLDQCDLWYDPDKDKITKYDKPIYHVTLREWLERIQKVIDVNSFGGVETWT